MEGVRNAAARVAGRAIAGPHDYVQIPALVERSKLRVANFYGDMDARLAEAPVVAGEHFSAADITSLVTVDFATRAFDMPISRTCSGTSCQTFRRSSRSRPDAIRGAGRVLRRHDNFSNFAQQCDRGHCVTVNRR